MFKKKILFIIDFIFGLTGGTENQLVKLINHLNGDKYDLHLICLHDTPWLGEHGKELKCEVRALHYNIFNHRDVRNIAVFPQLIRSIKDISPDIVFCYFRISYILGVMAARLAGVKNIISTRRDFGLWLDRKYLYPLKFANHFVKHVVTNSCKVAELVCAKENFNKDKILVIYNGIDVKKYTFSNEQKEALRRDLKIANNMKIIGIVAGLRPMKHHKTFLAAARHISNMRNDVEFMIVGDGPLKGELEKYAGVLGVKDKVHFLGWQEDVRPYLSIFDVGVNCSANEGLSNAIMEYMMFDVPSVVSRAGGNEELIINDLNGYTFELDDAGHLAQRVDMLLSDGEKRIAFANKSKEIIMTRFRMKHMVDQYENLIDRIVYEN